MALFSLSGVNASDWPDAYDGGSIAEGESLLLTLEQYNNAPEITSAGRLFLSLSGDANLSEIAENLSAFAGVEINFPHFADGRGFSLAVRLRRDFNYKGEIRATGHVIPDQALFLLRAGFDSAEIQTSRADAFGASLTRYQDFYQSDVRGTMGAGHRREAARTQV